MRPFDPRFDLVPKHREVDGFGKKGLGTALQRLALRLRIPMDSVRLPSFHLSMAQAVRGVRFVHHFRGYGGST
jgi:hypothetical protein